jgi:hypothetical protein
MRARWLQVAAAVAALAVAGPALGGEPSPGPVLRTEIGIASVARSNCSLGSIDSCDWSSFANSGSFVLGATYDSPMGSTSNLSVGVRLLSWKAGGDGKFEVEPSVGFTWKFPLAAWGEARLHVGAGLYLGTDFGGALRLGGGMGVILSPAVSLGFDLLLEGGALGGNLATVSSVTLGPAFRL